MSLLRELFKGELPRLVMFDLDGTLVDSVPDLAAAVDNTLRELGLPAAGIEQVRNWVGNGARVLVRRALAGGLEHTHVENQLAEQALELFMQFYAANHALTRVYPGVQATLDWLREQQVELAIVTNKPERFVAPLLDEKGLGGYFRWIVGGDTLPQQKPDPAALLHVLQLARVDASQALFIGDSRNDVLAAKAAGVPCVALSYGYNHGRPIAEENPAHVLDCLSGLLRPGEPPILLGVAG
ncbi:phosphoglycolate phosphatase [Pseudomonas sp. WS 5011]|uniref:phosphoglycolate phosphatase n=1 Tax=Pseudomonas sp. WS 5011 TaxID=2717477 RepID=UPI0014735F56|nr:phosphoglycolate phosphatase [Pseudomonas sp. WS 5011]NMY52883.1 phosphoglycolate phosphatase [Pseudomonas sp. WS 5011]